MHTLARVILAVVAVFVIVVTTTLVMRTRSAPVEPLAGPAISPADLQIKQVDLEEEAQGVRWRLKAEQALMYDQAGITKLKQPVANIFQRGRAWTIVGEEGDLDSKSNNVEVRRNVVVTSNDGLRLETSVLRWDAERKRLWTDAPVRLSREGSVVSGSGLSVLMADESTTVTGRVRATFLASKKR
ncbi:MAG TPA: LPS export ABC transporter periplasmic protein LptC [Candidatus Binatia bacterium]|nr:LPS export ABC transporter periplasmic protein LptC [Candidatus Binatia bacterium]